jgi:hypothetical protein
VVKASKAASTTSKGNKASKARRVISKASADFLA